MYYNDYLYKGFDCNTFDKKLNSVTCSIFDQHTPPIWDSNIKEVNMAINSGSSMQPHVNDLGTTQRDSISSDDAVIIVDSDEDIYSDEDAFEDEYVIDNIYLEEQDFLDTEKQNGTHYIGLCSHFPDRKLTLYANSMRPKTFFKYSHAHTLSYLQLYSIIKIRKPVIDIMQLAILDDATYTVILKTHWLRIIQRTWKKIFQLRKSVLNKRMQPSSIRLFEISGKYPSDANYMPTLNGMLYKYSCQYEMPACDDYLFTECH